MKNTVYSILIICAVLFLAFSNRSTRGIVSNNPESKFIQKVDSIVIGKMSEYDIPGLSVGIVRNGTIVYIRGYGKRNIKRNDPVTESTIFHTASVSKIFTAIAIMKLVDEKKLSLDNTINDLLPELKYQDQRVQQVTLRSMLNHTSGLPDVNNYHWEYNNQADGSLKDYVLGLNLKLEAQPGTVHKYSNLAYEILGYIIEKYSGVTFDDYLKDNVLNPSGMSVSDFRYFQIPDSLRSSPHSRKGGKISVRKTYPYTREHAPSSTLNSSAAELSKWMISFLKVLNDEEPSNIYQSMVEPSFDGYEYIGLGFQLSNFYGHKKIGHFGGDRGFRSYLMMLPDEDMGLVILGNCDYKDDFREEILHPIANLMLSEK